LFELRIITEEVWGILTLKDETVRHSRDTDLLNKKAAGDTRRPIHQ